MLEYEEKLLKFYRRKLALYGKGLEHLVSSSWWIAAEVAILMNLPEKVLVVSGGQRIVRGYSPTEEELDAARIVWKLAAMEAILNNEI